MIDMVMSLRNGGLAKVERRPIVVDQLENTITANLSRATRLRQAILKKAFSFPAEEVEQ
jgi:hypothetical protein